MFAAEKGAKEEGQTNVYAGGGVPKKLGIPPWSAQDQGLQHFGIYIGVPPFLRPQSHARFDPQTSCEQLLTLLDSGAQPRG